MRDTPAPSALTRQDRLRETPFHLPGDSDHRVNQRRLDIPPAPERNRPSHSARDAGSALSLPIRSRLASASSPTGRFSHQDHHLAAQDPLREGVPRTQAPVELGRSIKSWRGGSRGWGAFFPGAGGDARTTRAAQVVGSKTSRQRAAAAAGPAVLPKGLFPRSEDGPVSRVPDTLRPIEIPMVAAFSVVRDTERPYPAATVSVIIVCVIRSFADGATEDLFDGIDSRGARRALPRALWVAARRKLTQLNRVRSLAELNIPPGNRLQRLRGDRAGQYSIRINDQYRVCFRWEDEYADDVEITDYH
jgi:toxin HigB-1